MKIIHFADLHLGVESYGHIDPSSGLSSRFGDFLSSFDQLVDYAIGNSVDLVLFCGDAYKSRDPSQTQQREFARRIKRLSENSITTFLLVGNHDLPNAIGRATTTEIFSTLTIENVHVASRPNIYEIATRSGSIQIVAIPWLRRSAFMGQENARNLNFEELNHKMQQVLTDVINDNIKKLKPELPAILAAHVWVFGARIGSEGTMTIGQEHVMLPSTLANPVFNYVALGHIHRHQVLNEKPPVVYAGSLERIDFGDESDSKGFYLVKIDPDSDSGQRKVSYGFQQVEGRRFITIEVDLLPKDTEPTETVLKAIAKNEGNVKGAIVRLEINLPQELEGRIRDGDIRTALTKAYYLTIVKSVKRESRLRLGERTAEEITPLEALKAYLNSRNYSQKYTRLLLDYGKKLIKEPREEAESAPPETATNL
jgi:exonuclease SbcD